MNPHFRVLVVDDEDPARGELVYLLESFPEVDTVDEAVDAAEALGRLESNGYDAVFLDVRMPGLDGIKLGRILQRGPSPPRIVYVTAFEEHALDAFGLAAFDYLLKPVSENRLRRTIDRLGEAVNHPGAAPPVPQRREEEEGALNRLAVTAHGKILLVPLDDIRAAEVEGDRVAILTGNGRYISRLRLKELEDHLRGHGFMRVHRRFIVNLNHIVSIQPVFNNTYLLRLSGLPDVTVPVSRRHGTELRAAVRL